MFFLVFEKFSEPLQIRPSSSNLTPQKYPNASKISQQPSKIAPRGASEASWRLLERQLCSLGALLAVLGMLLGRSLDAHGRSWALLAAALERSWDPLRTLLARFRDLQDLIFEVCRATSRGF